MDIAVYTTPTCPYCRQVKEFLARRGVEFIEYDVSTNRTAADEMIRKTGQMAVPVIIIDNQVVVGFDRARLEQLLANGDSTQRLHFGLQVASRFGLAPADGAIVGRVTPSSLSERAGLRQGDIITEFNSRPVRNAHDLEDALSILTAGSRLRIVFLRGQQSLTSEIVI
jgi:glutaredoxin-like YruB-family protein